MNFFISNREVVSKAKEEFLREDGCENAGDNLRFGLYDLDTKKFNLFPEPESHEDLIYSSLNSKDYDKLKGSAKFFKDIYGQMTTQKGDLLFFIHGFNTDLDGVRKNFEILDKLYVKNPKSPIEHIVIFTWPGMTKSLPFHYNDDKKDAIRSGEALARGIEKLIDFFTNFLIRGKNPNCEQNINLMLHSMGNRVFKHCVLELDKSMQRRPEIFKEIILLAADVAYDIFDKDKAFYNLIDMGQRVHIFYHRRDRVLDISKYTKNFSNRLGRYGRRSIDSGLQGIFDYDVSDTNDDQMAHLRDDVLNHWYYYSSKEVVDKITEILNIE